MDGHFCPFLLSDIEQSIPARFEQQVAIYPARPAVVTPYLEWTYTQLNSIANATAAALIATCNTGSAPVCLLMDQGASLVAAILGVLKAGKFYVPLEPSHPVSTNEEIIDSSDAMSIITESKYFETAKKSFKNLNQVLMIESYLDAGFASNPAVAKDPLDPAYIFFTSGTSGKPKGVIDNHRNVLHNIFRYTNALQISPGDRLTMIQSGTFSGTVSSLFSALLNGAAILPFDFRNEGFEKMAHWIKNSNATIYHSVPSIFSGLAATGIHFPDIRIVRLEGDKASAEDIKRLAKSFSGNCRIAHGLGATETGLSCQYFSDPLHLLQGDDIPIGYPLPGLDVRIVDIHGSPVVNGEIGEIEICSEFLAMGYWQNPELTSTRFITDPGNSKIRHFRSGDMAFRDGNGLVFYIGRKDMEYKINGQFVAVNDVERALTETGLFKNVIVITRKDDADAPRLVAYVIQKEGSYIEPSRVRKLLLDKLPENSIPTAMVNITAFPLTEHGKVDRKSLPSPEIQPGITRQELLLEDEAAIVALWEEVLNVSPIGLKDNFFNLGGSSLSAALITAKLEKLTGGWIPPTTLLVAPTIEEFIEWLRKNNQVMKTPDPVIALRSTGKLTPIFMVDWQGGMGWHYKKLVELLGEDQPFYCLTSAGIPEPWPANTTIESLAGSVADCILAIQPSGPIRLAGTCFGGIVAFEAARQMQTKNLRVEQLVLLAVSPKDFPTLLPREAIRKYQQAVVRNRRIMRLSEIAHQGIRGLFRFLIYWIKKKYSEWSIRIIHKFRKKGPQLIPRHETFSLTDELVMAYRPEKSEIKTVLILAKNETKTYSSNTAKSWAGLAVKVEVIILPGSNEEVLNEPLVLLVADQLGKENN